MQFLIKYSNLRLQNDTYNASMTFPYGALQNKSPIVSFGELPVRRPV